MPTESPHDGRIKAGHKVECWLEEADIPAGAFLFRNDDLAKLVPATQAAPAMPVSEPPLVPTENSASKAQLVKETPAERRARWLCMVEEEEKHGKRGALQRVADREGVDRSNMGKDIAKAREARDTQRRSGAWTSQLVQDGKHTR